MVTTLAFHSCLFYFW